MIDEQSIEIVLEILEIKGKDHDLPLKFKAEKSKDQNLPLKLKLKLSQATLVVLVNEKLNFK